MAKSAKSSSPAAARDKAKAGSSSTLPGNDAPRAPVAGGDPGPAQSAAEPKAAGVPAQVAARPRRYLIAPRTAPGVFQTMSADSLYDELERMGVKILKRLRPRGFGLMSAAGGSSEIIVTEMGIDEGDRLRKTAPPNVIVEHDAELVHHGSAFSPQFSAAEFASPPPIGAATAVSFRITGSGGKPVPGAKVTVYAAGFPAEAVTDDKGAAELNIAGALQSVRGIYVKPHADYWERVLERPLLLADQANVIVLKSFAESFADFPQKNMLGWGQKVMGLDLIDPRFDGAGVRIGIMDSGCDNSHPQLQHILKGEDLVAADGGMGWTNDTMAHGTHCAGIIGARNDRQGGIRGFAPAAEIHALKVFPSGRISDLIDALDIAIERQLDVMNMSLGSPDPSELVRQKVQAAVNSGIACIVAAGNSGGPVQFPGMLPESITISAIGMAGEFPDDSNHARTVGGPVINGLFPAKFSCFGPQVRLTGPGVAIVSTVPGGGYAAWDGTSMATPHVTGLAALVLAHHPGLRGAKRDSSRVASLLRILTAAAVPVVGDPTHGGAGLPHAPTALAAAAAPAATPALPQQPSGGVSETAAPGPQLAPQRPQGPVPAGGIQTAAQPAQVATGQPFNATLAQLVARAQMGDLNALLLLAQMGDPVARQMLYA